MSANLLDGLTPTLFSGTTESEGTWHHAAFEGKADILAWGLSGQKALSANQTVHLGLSLRGASAGASDLHMVVAYVDGAGNRNWAWGEAMPVGTSWGRAEATVVIPSGMTMTVLTVSTMTTAKVPEVWMTAPALSYGSPVTLASSAHTPYATQDHLRSEYATKAALKVTSDAVTAEVEERGKLAGKVGTLESTSGTHTSKLEQLASSIKSLVKGESTYTDPDGKSATSGIYSLVTQTRDSVTALFGQYTKTADMQSQIATAKSQATAAANSATDSKLSSYTKTADLASTQAVKDAKKAGTDAASAASAAQTTADSAKSTAQAAASDAATAKTNASSAVSAANAAASTADSAKSAADRAQSTADAALDNAGTANGRVRAVEAKFSASIDGLDVRVRGVSEAVSAQGATVRDVERNMSFGLDGLVIGAADSASKVRITEKRETFEVDGKTVLALDGDTSTVDVSAMKIGGYVWTATNGGKNLTLVYRG